MFNERITFSRVLLHLIKNPSADVLHKENTWKKENSHWNDAQFCQKFFSSSVVFFLNYGNVIVHHHFILLVDLYEYLSRTNGILLMLLNNPCAAYFWVIQISFAFGMNKVTNNPINKRQQFSSFLQAEGASHKIYIFIIHRSQFFIIKLLLFHMKSAAHSFKLSHMHGLLNHWSLRNFDADV